MEPLWGYLDRLWTNSGLTLGRLWTLSNGPQGRVPKLGPCGLLQGVVVVVYERQAGFDRGEGVIIVRLRVASP